MDRGESNVTPITISCIDNCEKCFENIVSNITKKKK